MKRFLYPTILLVMFTACRNETKTTETATIPTGGTDIPFKGNWVSETYHANVAYSKSPKKAQEGSEECFIQIPGKTGQTTRMMFNFHETGPDLEVVATDSTFQLWEQQNGKRIKQLYTVTVIADNRIKLNNKTFLKISNATGQNGEGILEELLFKGVYAADDKKPVEFKTNGEVTGLGKYKYYKPIMDYMDAGLQIDQVALGETRDKMENFGFKMKSNKLNLFEIKCKTFDKKENRCVEVDFGKRLYSLKKTT